MLEPSPGSRRLVLATLLGALGALAFAPSALASDTFYLDNTSAVASLKGTSNYYGPEQNNDQDLTGCTTGPFPGPSQTLFDFTPGSKGSIELTRDPLNLDCPSNIDPQQFGVYTPDANGGGYWAPLDPFIGFASLTCGISGNTTPGVVANVDGLTCTVADSAAAPDANFVSSAAPVRGNSAVALIQHFPASQSSADQVQGQHEVTVSTPSNGNVIGETKAMLVSGEPAKIRIPLTKRIRKRVAKRGALEVKATLKRIDGKPGTGDRARLILLADDTYLPF